MNNNISSVEVFTGATNKQIQDQIQSTLEKKESEVTSMERLLSIDESYEWVLHIKTLTGKVVNVYCNEKSTVADVKATIEIQEGIPFQNQQLVKKEAKVLDSEKKVTDSGPHIQLSNIILENDASLSGYGIGNEEELILFQIDSQYSHGNSTSSITSVNIQFQTSFEMSLTVPCDEHTTIEELKSKIRELAKQSTQIEELTTIAKDPSMQLRLIYRSEELKGHQKLRECRIKQGSNIHLVLYKTKEKIIFIQMPNGERYQVDCDTDTDTIGDIKEKVYALHSIPKVEQNLIFLGRMLENDQSTLSDCKIKNGDTLHFAHKQRDENQQPLSLTTADSEPIFVKTLTGRILHFDNISVHSETVGNLKVKIQTEESIPSDKQLLVFDEKVLEDNSKTLSDYNIELGDMVTLKLSAYEQKERKETSQPTSTQLTIHVKGPIGNPVKIDVDFNDAIAEVKAKVYELCKDDMGLPEGQELELIFEGEKLENSKLLSQYRVESFDTLHLRLGIRKLEEITVKSLPRDSITLSVTSNDTIADVKNKISAKKDISPDMERIVYSGSERSDACTLEELNIQNKGILYLVVRQVQRITIKTLSTEKDISLDFNPECTVAQLKYQIQEKENIPVNKQELWFRGITLKDEETLRNSGIENECTLYMSDSSEPESRLWIKIPALKKTITLDYDSEATISNLKFEVFERDNILKSDYENFEVFFYFNKVRLEEGRSIGDYGIPKGEILDLVFVAKEDIGKQRFQ